ncbi:hypothetical protein [Ralstonia sp. Ralssp110]
MKRAIVLVLIGSLLLAGCNRQSWDEKREEEAKARFLGDKK